MSESFDTLGKGLGPLSDNVSHAKASTLEWSILREDVSLPVAILREARIEHNLQWMSQFMQRYGVQLAPHGKTTMSPALFKRQMEAGAWGITLATAPQVRVAFTHGIRRVLMANQLVGKANMAAIADMQADDPTFSFSCLVDSVANIDCLGRYFSARGQKLRLLLEYGVPGGRTGIRDDEQEQAVRAAIARWPKALALIGVEVYEGVLKDEGDIRHLLKQTVVRACAIAEAGEFAEPNILLSGAGSAWFDLVAEEFSQHQTSLPFEIVLRPGCYLTHDVGIYKAAEARIQANNPVAQEMRRSLLPALQLWAYVQSRPEPGRAIIALGKRDAAFDAGFPIPSLHFRPSQDETPSEASADWKISAMMDQHAFMDISPEADLEVGDMLCFDISHPCLTFDKWKQLLLVDEQYRVTGAVATYF
jgi:D-serine dehydratase